MRAQLAELPVVVVVAVNKKEFDVGFVEQLVETLFEAAFFGPGPSNG